MLEEEVVESTPTETMESDEDFFSEVDDEVMESLGEEEPSEEETNEESKPNEPQEDNSKDEVDFGPLLKALSGKIKYNKENVNVESIEDLINGYQKGLNYDKKVAELENLQNSKLEQYAKQKATELGISVDEYMDRVEKYEEEQQKAQEQARLEEFINNGVPEDIAKEVIAGAQVRKQLQQELNELKAERDASKKEEEKNKEYQDFLNNFPGVKPEEIPRSVFEDAENSSLSDAYMKWKIGELQKENEILKTNEKNKKSSVGSTTETGATNEKHERDLFLEGFDE